MTCYDLRFPELARRWSTPAPRCWWSRPRGWPGRARSSTGARWSGRGRSRTPCTSSPSASPARATPATRWSSTRSATCWPRPATSAETLTRDAGPGGARRGPADQPVAGQPPAVACRSAVSSTRATTDVPPRPSAAEPPRIAASRGDRRRAPVASLLRCWCVLGGLAALVVGHGRLGPAGSSAMPARWRSPRPTLGAGGAHRRTPGRLRRRWPSLLGAGSWSCRRGLLRTGAAVMTCVVTAVLAVMVTVPGAYVRCRPPARC